MTKRIAVVTTDKEIADFYKFEFSYRGFSVDVFSKIGTVNDKYTICFVDIHTVGACPSVNECVYVEISREDASHVDFPIPTLTWPTPISDIDRLCDIVLFGEKCYSNTSRANDEDTFLIADFANRTVVHSGKIIKLTQSELDILTELCNAEGEIVSRERIMSVLGATQGNISDVYIYHLRKKLESLGNRRFIFSERGVGYRTVLKFKR